MVNMMPFNSCNLQYVNDTNEVCGDPNVPLLVFPVQLFLNSQYHTRSVNNLTISMRIDLFVAVK